MHTAYQPVVTAVGDALALRSRREPDVGSLHDANTDILSINKGRYKHPILASWRSPLFPFLLPPCPLRRGQPLQNQWSKGRIELIVAKNAYNYPRPSRNLTWSP